VTRPGMVREEAGGIVLYEGRVVLHRTELGNLNFPKGKIERGETAEQAAAREVLEETGLVAQSLEPLGTLELLYIPKPQTIRFFLMRAIAAPGWGAHKDRDAELVPVEAVVERLTFKEYRRFWRGVAERVAVAAEVPRATS
jgi:mutator protein MutT